MGVNIQTIKDIKFYLSRELNGLYPDPEIRALTTIITRTVFKVLKLHTLALPETPVNQKQNREIIRICRELKRGKPIQYITGETNFYNCLFRVNSETLIPRSETEELVDLIIKENKGFRGSILDIGTGSGCIAIVLAINLPGSVVTGIDISQGAIELAKENARLNNTHVTFFPADVFIHESIKTPHTDIIVSNPPYILASEKREMANNVLDYEPHTALFVPDDDPLKYYSAIISLAEKILIPRGKLYFEINEAMGNQIVHLLGSFNYKNPELIKDINGRDRIIKANKHE
ncbi:MAG: peptide chain release factor N(5)-glutamine methyltransferase [Bacteroidales bacterium]|jgi:release factor glutamine methyltransferase|nr:peptide chain release factor N(5)-glutamine methyltransferase [Bacteroidales bacterium]